MTDPCEPTTEDRRSALSNDLEALCKKHGVTMASFCGQLMDKSFYGACLVESNGRGTPRHIVEASFGVARLWQHARETVRSMMDKAERGWT
jgi:hypothetical protein